MSNGAGIKRVFIVQYSSSLDGSAVSGLTLANCFYKAGWQTHVAFGHVGPMEARYQRSGHKTYVIEHRNWLRRSHPIRFSRDVFGEWQTSKKFRCLLDQVGPHIVYINTAVSLAGAVAAKKNGVPCIWHLREQFGDVGGELESPRFVRPLTQHVFDYFSSQIVCNSHAVTTNLLGDTLANRAMVIPNSVQANFFNDTRSQTEAKKELRLPVTGKLIGVPGTMRSVKGHPFFFRAAARLVEQIPDLRIAVTGNGGKVYLKHLQAAVSQLGIADHVIFLGTITDMPAFYRACDVVCIPSRAESFGRVVIEAFASGVPVVATAVGGILEIVDHNIDGLLVSYGDTSELATALEALISDRSLRDRLSYAALHKANERYGERVHCETVSKLVDSVLRQ